MKKFLLIYTLFLFCTQSIKAQVPGYLGKRFAIGYAYTLSPLAYWSDIKTKDGQDLNIRSVNTRHNIELNWAVKERTFIAINYSYQNWGILTNLLEDGNISTFSSFIDNTMQSDLGVSDFKFINASSNKFTFLYGKTKGIAPRGSYAAIGLSLESITPEVTDLNNQVVNLPTINNYGMVARIGKRRVYYDKLMLDVSANIELGAGVFSEVGNYNKFDRNFEGIDYYDVRSTLKVEDINTKAKTQASYYSLLSLRVGLYYLL